MSSSSSLAGTGALIRSMLRRDRVRIPVWILAIAFSVMGSVASFAKTYPTAADRQARARVLDISCIVTSSSLVMLANANAATDV